MSRKLEYDGKLATRQFVGDAITNSMWESTFEDKIKRVTRFEAIKDGSRLVVEYNVSLEFVFQDDGKTLKVFLSD